MKPDQPVLQVDALSCGYDGREVLHAISFSLEAGKTTMVVGPNGVGKTTLFKTVLGFLPSLGGSLIINGRDTHAWSRREFASVVAYVPQQHIPTFAFTVRELVLMGRTPALNGFASPSKADEAIVDEVLESLELQDLAQRDYTTLSGGERQMVLIARALAQRPSLLVMDEPCASLDLGNQVVLLERIVALNTDGLAVLVTTHDPNHAFMLESDVVCLKWDKAFECGPACDVLTEENLSRLYNTSVSVSATRSPQGKMMNTCVSFLEGR